jgi:hypothetical protein
MSSTHAARACVAFKRERNQAHTHPHTRARARAHAHAHREVQTLKPYLHECTLPRAVGTSGPGARLAQQLVQNLRGGAAAGGVRQVLSQHSAVSQKPSPRQRRDRRPRAVSHQ